MASNDILLAVVVGIIGLLAFFKPILLYNGMKDGSNKNVSYLHFFIIGIVYIALSVLILKFYYAKNNLSLIFSIILVLLGFWNIYFGLLVKKLKPGTDDAEEKESEDTKAEIKDQPESKG
ncbi:MAG: hypothetical protein WAX69_10555 [Victivallales bacterium]